MHNAFKKYKGLFRKFQWWRVKLSGGGWAWRSGSTYDESTHCVQSSESNWKTFIGKFGKPVLCIKRHGFPHYYLQEEAFGKLEATGTDMLTIDDVLDDEEPANEAGDIIDLSDLSEESELIVDMTNNDVTDDVSFAAVIALLSGLTICQGLVSDTPSRTTSTRKRRISALGLIAVTSARRTKKARTSSSTATDPDSESLPSSRPNPLGFEPAFARLTQTSETYRVLTDGFKDALVTWRTTPEVPSVQVASISTALAMLRDRFRDKLDMHNYIAAARLLQNSEKAQLFVAFETETELQRAFLQQENISFTDEVRGGADVRENAV